jgi:hypothetical protein
MSHVNSSNSDAWNHASDSGVPVGECGGEAALTDEQTMTLLGAASTSMPEPLRAVCDRLREPDGGAWLVGYLRPLALDVGTSTTEVAAGTAPLHGLETIKERAKEATTTGPTSEERQGTLTVYYAAVAAALAGHGALISTRPRDEWDERFLALAAAAPEPWAKLFRAAADRE